MRPEVGVTGVLSDTVVEADLLRNQRGKWETGEKQETQKSETQQTANTMGSVNEALRCDRSGLINYYTCMILIHEEGDR